MLGAMLGRFQNFACALVFDVHICLWSTYGSAGFVVWDIAINYYIECGAMMKQTFGKISKEKYFAIFWQIWGPDSGHARQPWIQLSSHTTVDEFPKE